MQRYRDVVLNGRGEPVPNVSVLVLTYPAGDLADLFSDDSGTVLANPVPSDPNGAFSFKAANGHYSLVISGAGVTAQTVNDIALNDAEDAVADAVTATKAELAAGSGSNLVTFMQAGTGAVPLSVQDVLRETVSVKRFGAKGDGATADNVKIASAVGAHPDDLLTVPAGTYNLSSYVGVDGTPLRLHGRGAGVSQLKTTSTSVQSALALENTGNSRIEGMTLDVTAASAGAAAVGHPVSMIDVSNSVVRDVEITGLSGVGSGLLAYPALETNYIRQLLLENIRVSGVLANSTNTNGLLIVNGQYCQMRGVYAEGIAAYAIEYKNATGWSTISDAIAVGSVNGISFGQTTTDQTGVSYSAVSNFIAKDCAQGVVIGKGGYNALSNGVVHIQTPNPINKIGVRVSSQSIGNSMANMLVVGDVSEAVRLDALRNYVSVSAHTSGSGLVTLDAGAQGNVVEIQHPGTRTSITTNIVDNSGNASLSGATANPIYCHATGTYRGILNLHWRWQYDSSGAAVASSAHRWIYESKGDAMTTILTDGTGVNGYTVSGPAGQRGITYVWSSDYWRISTASAGYRFFGTTFRPETDLIPDLGAATFRFKTGYLQNVVLTPPASVTPATNGQMTFELTSDTQLKIKVKGSDGVVRSASLTLA